LSEIISGPIIDLHEDFWDEMRKAYLKEMILLADNSEQILTCTQYLPCLYFSIDDFKCDEDEIQEFLLSTEKNLYEQTKHLIRKQFEDIKKLLHRKFTRIFKKDEHGVIR
jgi:hypothetical protein